MAAQRRRTVPAAAWKREEEKKRENPGERRRITVHGDNKGAVSPHRPAAELHLLLLLRCDACVTPGVRKRRRRSVSGADGTKWSTIVCVEIRMAWMWKRKSLIATSLIVAVSLFVVVVNYTEKSYYLLQPVFGQTFRRPWMFSKPPYKAFKPHLGYISIPTQKPLKLHCELCSIVSSSGQMLGQGAGPEIDRSPCIWRMNNAPTRGFEKDVGRRTTLRVVSHTSVPLLLQKPQYFFGQANDTIYVVWGPLRNMRKDGKGIVYNMLRQAVENYPNARIYVTTEDRMNHCDMVFKKETGKDRIQSGSYLSTGWFTLILAMDMCKEIHIYGMINDTYCKTDDYRKVPYHYYEVGSRDECAEYVLHESAPYGGHRFITEKAVFAKWAKSHAIKFFNPPWQLS